MASTRRVVAGTGESGASVVLSDGPAAARVTLETMGGFSDTTLWRFSETPVRAEDGGDPGPGPFDLDPPPGTIVFVQSELPPEGSATPADQSDLRAELREKVPALARLSDPRRPGYHRTNTVDLLTVVSGAVVLEVDSEEVLLETGDHVVLQAPWHAWHNRGSQPCVLAGVMIALLRPGSRSGVSPV